MRLTALFVVIGLLFSPLAYADQGAYYDWSTGAAVTTQDPTITNSPYYDWSMGGTAIMDQFIAAAAATPPPQTKILIID